MRKYGHNIHADGYRFYPFKTQEHNGLSDITNLTGMPEEGRIGRPYDPLGHGLVMGDQIIEIFQGAILFLNNGKDLSHQHRKGGKALRYFQ